eukprot:2671376-Amphidinium_carterae.1
MHLDSTNDPACTMIVVSSGTSSVWVQSHAGVDEQLYRGTRVRGSWHTMRRSLLAFPGRSLHAVHATTQTTSVVLYCTARRVWASHATQLRGMGFVVHPSRCVEDGMNPSLESQDDDLANEGGADCKDPLRTLKWRPSLPTIPERSQQEVFSSQVASLAEAQ